MKNTFLGFVHKLFLKRKGKRMHVRKAILKLALKKCMIEFVIVLNVSPFSTLSGGVFEKIHCYSLFLKREEKNLVSEMKFLTNLRNLS